MAQRGRSNFNSKKKKSSGIFIPSYFKVKVTIDITGEKFPFKVYNEMTIKDMKAELEFVTGVPFNLQRLWYLDEADLQDDSEVRQNFIVPDGLIHMTIHSTWRKIVEAVAQNDIEELFALGVNADSDFTSPNVEFMSKKNLQTKRQFFTERGFMSLFMASHRGNLDMCRKLVASGTRVNRVTSCGRTALHVAAARGHGDVMDVLLERGAKAAIADKYGETPSIVALKFGHKDCDRHLFMFKWRQRAKRTKSAAQT